MIHGKGSQFGTTPINADDFKFIELKSDTHDGLNELLNLIGVKINITRKRMQSIWRNSDLKDLDEYQELNDRLYWLNVYKAEFEWKRNML